jgi:hypothetical protein
LWPRSVQVFNRFIAYYVTKLSVSLYVFVPFTW